MEASLGVELKVGKSSVVFEIAIGSKEESPPSQFNKFDVLTQHLIRLPSAINLPHV